MRKIRIKAIGSISWMELILILVLSAAFFDLDSRIAFSLMLPWIVFALVKLIANIERFKNAKLCGHLRGLLGMLDMSAEDCPPEDRVLRCFLQYNMGSRVVIYLYTILLILFGLTEGRFLSTNIMTFINGVSAISVLYLFGKRGVRCSFIALCITWFAMVVTHKGYLEFHDLSFGAGYVLLYFLFIHRKWTKAHILCCSVVALLILCAFKRIGIAALVLTAVFWLVLQRFKTVETRKRVIRWSCIAAIVACYLFVLAILQGWLVEVLDAIGVNVMGRNFYYEALGQYCRFVPWFPGLGRNASATLFTTTWVDMNVGNVHSDILRMYAECGFILFGLWLLVYWIFLPKAIEKECGYKAMEFFFLCTVYTFAVYTTDNTELYLINQYFYMLLPIYVAMQELGKFQRGCTCVDGSDPGGEATA